MAYADSYRSLYVCVYAFYIHMYVYMCTYLPINTHTYGTIQIYCPVVYGIYRVPSKINCLLRTPAETTDRYTCVHQNAASDCTAEALDESQDQALDVCRLG